MCELCATMWPHCRGEVRIFVQHVHYCTLGVHVLVFGVCSATHVCVRELQTDVRVYVALLQCPTMHLVFALSSRLGSQGFHLLKEHLQRLY